MFSYWLAKNLVAMVIHVVVICLEILAFGVKKGEGILMSLWS